MSVEEDTPAPVATDEPEQDQDTVVPAERATETSAPPTLERQPERESGDADAPDLADDIVSGDVSGPPAQSPPVAVVYAGRLPVSDESAAGLVVLTDTDVLPRALWPALDDAAVLVLLDAWTFPYEALRRDDRDIPLVVRLPDNLPAADVELALRSDLFEDLTFFDTVVTVDDDLWRLLRRRYSLAESQRLQTPGGDPAVVLDAIRARLRSDVAAGEEFRHDPSSEGIQYWSERGDALAARAPHRAIGSVHHGLRDNKAMHRVQAAALLPELSAAQALQPSTRPFSVLEIGTGVGRWASAFDLSVTQFTGVDVSSAMVEQARQNFPQLPFQTLAPGEPLPLPDEQFDVVFTATVLHHNPAERKRQLLEDMYRLTRSGGRLVFLEDFVASRSAASATVFPQSIGQFLNMVADVTRRRVVLEHLEALRYPYDDFFRSGLVVLTKIGVPTTW